jgi:hypothetical protein
LRDRNFTASMLFVAVIGLTYYASLALRPPYLQDLMNYPVVTAGLVTGRRGVGTMVVVPVVGRLTGRLDTRLPLSIGLGLSALDLLDDDQLDAGGVTGRDRRRRRGPGGGAGLSVRAAQPGSFGDAAPDARA